MAGDVSAKWPTSGTLVGRECPLWSAARWHTDVRARSSLIQCETSLILEPETARLLAMPATLYKARGMPTKGEVCAICVERTRGKTKKLALGRGVTVWLCEGHASEEFQRARSGRDFVLTLQRLWSAHGCLTTARSRALADHLAANRGSGRSRDRRRPGSYAWPALRLEAEERFRRGEDPRRVITELRARHADGPAKPPSVRTLRRWFLERRWMNEYERPLEAFVSPSREGWPIGREGAGQLADPPPTQPPATSPASPASPPARPPKEHRLPPDGPFGPARDARPPPSGPLEGA